ncbi:rCG49040, partial [Rattus norvegicus]
SRSCSLCRRGFRFVRSWPTHKE